MDKVSQIIRLLKDKVTSCGTGIGLVGKCLGDILKSTFSKIGLLGKILSGIVLIIGLIGGWLSLWDRIFPPNIVILELTPVIISEPKDFGGTRVALRGVGVLLHVQSKNRQVAITGISLEGKRCLDIDEFLGTIETTDKMTLDEVHREFDRLRPFQKLSHFGWPSTSPGPVTLGPWEESYIRFTFLEPTLEGPYMEGDKRYFGSTEKSDPLIRRFGFTVLDMFTIAPSDRTSWTPGRLRDEILDGILTFQVMAGGTRFPVPVTAFRPPLRIRPKEWKEGGLQPLLSEKWSRLEIEQGENRSINCNLASKTSTLTKRTN